jgi:hypothetical protein
MQTLDSDWFINNVFKDKCIRNLSNIFINYTKLLLLPLFTKITLLLPLFTKITDILNPFYTYFSKCWHMLNEPDF